MSNTLAVATVTATLQRLLQTTAATEVPGTEVKTMRPDAHASREKGEAAPLINIYLYQVLPNTAYRNEELPLRSHDGKLINTPTIPLDLYYLFSFYGDEQTIIPQRLLGSVVEILHTRPILDPDTIVATISNTAFDFLQGSNLHEQVEQVKFSPFSMDLEELSKLWSVFFQTPHALSVSYRASVVLIESKEIPEPKSPEAKTVQIQTITTTDGLT